MSKNTHSFSAAGIEALHNGIAQFDLCFACQLGVFNSILSEIAANNVQHRCPLRDHDDFVFSIIQNILNHFQYLLALE